MISYQLHKALSAPSSDKHSLVEIFDTGSMLNDHELCAKAIRKADISCYWTEGAEPGREEQFGQSLIKGGLLDLATYPLSRLKQLPIETVWVILRASYNAPTTSGSKRQAEYDATAERYTKLMKLPGRSSC
jgi:hypothetical protein